MHTELPQGWRPVPRRPRVSGWVGGAIIGALTSALLCVGLLQPRSEVRVVERGPVQVAQAPQGLSPAEIGRRHGKGVVAIRANSSAGDDEGSGFFIDARTVITNAHVVAGAETLAVVLDDTPLKATLVGVDASTDLAVLSVDTRDQTVTPLRLGDSDTVRVGEPVVAIGNPFGLSGTLTSGIVSAKARSIEAPNGFSIENVIQTDAAINPGNSGGPLLDRTGQVIGVNSQIISTGGRAAQGGGGSLGIGFAVPSNTVRDVVPRLRRDGSIERAYLGIQGRTVSADERRALGVPGGARLITVYPGGPAAKARLRGSETHGDVIVAVDGTAVRTMEALVKRIDAARVGDTLTLKVVAADGDEKTRRVIVGNRPAARTSP